jgi:Mn-dependent DtxR family transcriptional regulator
MPNTRITAATVLRSIADDKSMALFRTVARSDEGIDSKYLKDKLKLTRKQYYSRLTRIAKSGLIKKKRGKYALTTFGKVVYDSQATVGIALSKLWELVAIDSLDMSDDPSEWERQKLIDTLLRKNKL